MKKIIFTLITIFLFFILSFAVFLSPYVYKKLTFSYNYCNSYGDLDHELGWKLKKNANSCISLKNYITGKVFFDTKVYTNKDGFRDNEPGKESYKDSIVAFGDSWTFGYGVNFKETWPALLSDKTGKKINNLGIPGYSVLSSYLLLKRHINDLNPKIAIFFDIGASDRSWCPKVKPEKQLVPCYYLDKSKKIKIIYPNKEFFDKSVKQGRYPGAYLSAGYNFYTYLFFLKPKQFISLYISKIKKYFIKNKESTYDNSCDYSDNCEEYMDKVYEYEFNLFYDLAIKNDLILIFVDGSSRYENAKNLISHSDNKNLIYLSRSDFWQKILKIHSSIGESEVRVPGDGHFNQKGYEVIAEELKKIMLENSLI